MAGYHLSRSSAAGRPQAAAARHIKHITQIPPLGLAIRLIIPDVGDTIVVYVTLIHLHI
jgi:hypothetical protein